MKAVVAAFNQEKALVGAFSVITNLRMELLEALVETDHWRHYTDPQPGVGTPGHTLHCSAGGDCQGEVREVKLPPVETPRHRLAASC